MSRQCKNCPRRTLSSDSVAWGFGWRWFTGTTQDGRDLADILCPHCAGRLEDGPFEDEPSWDVECRTCEWSFSDEFEPGDEPLWTARDAVALGREHRCDRDVWIADPGSGGSVRRLGDFDLDGNLRRP